MEPRVVVFLQHLVRERPKSKRTSAIGLAVNQQFGLGLEHQTHLRYTDADLDRAAEILRSNGIDAGVPQGSGSRGERAGFGATSEKWRAPPVMTGYLAVRPGSPGCHWQGAELNLPGRGFLAAELETALAVEAARLLVVENLECLKQIERYRWLGLPPATLAVWRGGPLFAETAVQALLNRSTLPVWCWLDFDPAGLAIAARLPRLERVIVPDEGVVRTLTEERRQGLHDRYLQQLPGSQRAIAESTNDEIRSAWALMKKKGLALPQELLTDA
jgi:hypothetical protein